MTLAVPSTGPAQSLTQSAVAEAQAAASSAGQSLTLHDVIKLALTNSPDLQPAADRVAVADIQRRLAESDYGFKVSPSFHSGAGTYGYDQQSLGFNASKKLPLGTQVSLFADSTRWNNGNTPFRDGGYGFNLSQPLLRGAGPAARADLINARRGEEASTRQLTESRQQLVVDVARTYFSVVRLRRLVATSEVALERAKKLRVGSEARANIGLATQIDVLRADLLVSQSEADLELQRESLETTLDQLKLSIGHAPESAIEVAEADVAGDPFGVGQYALQPVDDLVMLGIATRQDVRESRERVNDARRNETVARWNLLPDISLNASYARRGLGAFDPDSINRLLGGWRFGMASSVPLDRAAQTASVETAQISLRTAETDVVVTERRVAADIRRAHRAWLRSADSIAIQQKTADIADKELRLAQLRYERGIADNFDVIDAEQHVLQAQAGLISAQVDRQLAGLALLRALGTLSPEELVK